MLTELTRRQLVTHYFQKPDGKVPVKDPAILEEIEKQRTYGALATGARTLSGAATGMVAGSLLSRELPAQYRRVIPDRSRRRVVFSGIGAICGAVLGCLLPPIDLNK